MLYPINKTIVAYITKRQLKRDDIYFDVGVGEVDITLRYNTEFRIKAKIEVEYGGNIIATTTAPAQGVANVDFTVTTNSTDGGYLKLIVTPEFKKDDYVAIVVVKMLVTFKYVTTTTVRGQTTAAPPPYINTTPGPWTRAVPSPTVAPTTPTPWVRPTPGPTTTAAPPTPWVRPTPGPTTVPPPTTPRPSTSTTTVQATTTYPGYTTPAPTTSNVTTRSVTTRYVSTRPGPTTTPAPTTKPAPAPVETTTTPLIPAPTTSSPTAAPLVITDLNPDVTEYIITAGQNLLSADFKPTFPMFTASGGTGQYRVELTGLIPPLFVLKAPSTDDPDQHSILATPHYGPMNRFALSLNKVTMADIPNASRGLVPAINQVGSYPITVTVNDGTSQQSKNITLKVADFAGTNSAPTLINTGTYHFTELENVNGGLVTFELVPVHDWNGDNAVPGAPGGGSPVLNPIRLQGVYQIGSGIWVIYAGLTGTQNGHTSRFHSGGSYSWYEHTNRQYMYILEAKVSGVVVARSYLYNETYGMWSDTTWVTPYGQ
jgi:hypothetical protein